MSQYLKVTKKKKNKIKLWLQIMLSIWMAQTFSSTEENVAWPTVWDRAQLPDHNRIIWNETLHISLGKICPETSRASVIVKALLSSHLGEEVVIVF